MTDAEFFQYIQNADNRNKIFNDLSGRMLRWREKGVLHNLYDVITGEVDYAAAISNNTVTISYYTGVKEELLKKLQENFRKNFSQATVF